MKVLATAPGELQWMEARTGLSFTGHAKGIKATDARGNIGGMVAYDCWVPNSVQMHFAIDSPIAIRALIGPSFSYPFIEAGRGLVVGIVAACNKKSVTIARKLGFKEAHRIPSGWSVRDDLIVFEMRREECRFLSSNRKAA